MKCGMVLTLGMFVGTTFAQEIEKAASWTIPCACTNAAGKVFRYRWSEPEKTLPGKRYPLVVLLHGAGERGVDNTRQLYWGATPVLAFMREKGIEGCFLAGQVPEGRRWVEKDWDALAHRMDPEPSETLGLLLERIDGLMAELPIDPARVYVTGISMGGYGTWELLQRRPRLFAAAMPCCGGGDVQEAWKLRDVPIWAWHGECDSAVPVTRSRDMVAALWQVGGKIRYTEVPDCDHAVWIPAYASREALEWIFKQQRAEGAGR